MLNNVQHALLAVRGCLEKSKKS